MLMYNDQTKAPFPLSLDGRGARGEGALAAMLFAFALAFAAPAALAAPGGLCGAQTTDGLSGTDDTITCDPEESYPDGIDYSSDGGNLRLEETLVVDGKEVVLLDVNDDGLNVTGTGDDNLTFFAEAGTADGDPTRAGVTGSAGAVINYLSESGDIDITAGIVDATGSATHAIRAESTAGGNITIDLGPAANGGFGTPSGLTSSGIGIHAETTGAGTVAITTNDFIDVDGAYGIQALAADGDITIATNDDVDAQSFDSQESAIRAVTSGDGAISITNQEGPVTGRLRGIEAETGGAGALTIDVFGAVRANDGFFGTPIAAIDATTGSGLLTINVNGTATVDGSRGRGIRTDAGGDAQINIGADANVDISFGSIAALDLTAAAGTTTTVNNASTLNIDGETSFLGAGGGTIVINNSGDIRGDMDFNMTGAGTSVINNTGLLQTREAMTVEGLQTLNNDGIVSLGLRSTGLGEGQEIGFTFIDLGNFNNSGEVFFGQQVVPLNPNHELHGEVISAQGAAFHGTPGESILWMQGALAGGQGQAGCGEEQITVADCFDLRGGATSGKTAIRFTANALDYELNPFVLSLEPELNPGVVLVDVNGGESHAGDFVLHPDSTKMVEVPDNDASIKLEEVPVYEEDAVYGAVLDTGGLFDYALLYNPDTQQHLLTSVPQEEGVEYASFAHQAISAWHATSDTVVGRQADLREGALGGGWVRFVSEWTERESAPTLSTQGNDFTYDQDYSFNTRALIGGFDLFSGDGYVIGAHAGVVITRADYELTSSRDDGEGATFGAYGGWWHEVGPGLLTVDGTINVNMLMLDHDVTDHENSSHEVQSLGARVEAGWRVPLLGEALYVQPLATAAVVRTDIEEMELRSYDADFENVESTRGALGLRVGGGLSMGGDRVGGIKYWLSGRAWEEDAGDDTHVVFKVENGEDLRFFDDLSGSFEEVNAGVSVYTPQDALNVYLSGGAKFYDGDTDNYNISFGARLRW